MNKAFHCVRCGRCCMWHGVVRLDEREVDDIAAQLGLAVTDFLERYTDLAPDRRSLTLKEYPDGRCVMLALDPVRCIIQRVKPRQCRDFPEKWNFPGWRLECKGAQQS